MRINELRVERCDTNFKNMERKIEITKPKPEPEHTQSSLFQNMLDAEMKKPY